MYRSSWMQREPKTLLPFGGLPYSVHTLQSWGFFYIVKIFLIKKRMYIYIHICITKLLTLQQKLTQHCISIIIKKFFLIFSVSSYASLTNLLLCFILPDIWEISVSLSGLFISYPRVEGMASWVTYWRREHKSVHPLPIFRPASRPAAERAVIIE